MRIVIGAGGSYWSIEVESSKDPKLVDILLEAKNRQGGREYGMSIEGWYFDWTSEFKIDHQLVPISDVRTEPRGVEVELPLLDSSRELAEELVTIGDLCWLSKDEGS